MSSSTESNIRTSGGHIMFDFLFGRRPEPEQPERPRDQENSPRNETDALTGEVLKSLELTTDTTSRCSPRECESQADFVKSLQPGDVIMSGNGSSMVLSRRDGWLCLLDRERCGDLQIKEMKESRFRTRDVDE